MGEEATDGTLELGNASETATPNRGWLILSDRRSILPHATGLNVFGSCYRRCRAQHRDQIAMPASFDAKNAKAIVRIMESDTFDRTS